MVFLRVGFVGFSKAWLVFLGSGLFLRYWLVFLGIGWFFWIDAHQQNKDMKASKPAQEQIHLIYIGNVRLIFKEFYREQLRKNSSG